MRVGLVVILVTAIGSCASPETRKGCEVNCKILFDCGFDSPESVPGCTDQCVLDLGDATAGCVQAVQAVGACGDGRSCTDFEAGACATELDQATAVCDGLAGDAAPPDAATDASPDAVLDECAMPLSGCDTTAPGTMTVCGRLHDVEDDTVLRGTGAAACPVTGEPSGPCQLAIRAFDAQMFLSDPTSAPILPAEPYQDRCGRYRLANIEAPGGALALAVDHHPLQPNPNAHVTTAVLLAVEANTARPDVVAYATRTATNAAWTTGTGETTSLAAQGVHVDIYRGVGVAGDPLAGTPAPGVQVLRNGAMIPNDDHYFSDSSATTRQLVSPAQAATGMNGTALVLRQPNLGVHSGTPGPLPAGCSWSAIAGGTIAGVVLVQIHLPVETSCGF